MAQHTTHQRPLRLITCGSVDDGKSTLIGRLLYDSKALMIDQLDALAKHTKASQTAQTSDGNIDLSLVTDGLEAEREQGITIDVAYRYFTTPTRKFIIADAPGHEQYTRNMITGASKSDAAIILIDVTKLDFSTGTIELLPQTKRHSAIAGLLGLQHVIVAVNKMDAIEFDREKFDRVVTAFNVTAKQLQLPPFTTVPVSALNGDGVVTHTDRTAWFNGPALLPLLETLELDRPRERATQRSIATKSHIAVQYVTRDSNNDHRRWFTGDVAEAALSVGDSVTVFPGNATAVVSELRTPRASVQRAEPGESVAIALDRQLDISRGDWIVTTPAAQILSREESLTAATHVPTKKSCVATVAWLDNAPLNLGRRLIARHGARWVPVRIAKVRERLRLSDVTWQEELQSADEFAAAQANDLIRVDIEFASELPISSFATSKTLGALVLVDPGTNATAGAAFIH
jgi:sulfate adenylyltransferase subunit 1